MRTFANHILEVYGPVYARESLSHIDYRGVRVREVA